MPTTAAPARYRVLNFRIRYPADLAVAARLAKGAAIDPDTVEWRIAYAGSVVNDLPPNAVPVLLAAGDIEPSTAALVRVTEPPAGGGA